MVRVIELDRSADVLPLVFEAELLVTNPAPSMRADVEASLANGRTGGGIAFERQGTSEDRRRRLSLAQDAQHAPEAHPCAELEHRLGREISSGETAPSLCQPSLGDAVAIG